MKRKDLVFILCFLSYTAIYIARLNLSMASPGLTTNYQLSSAEVGLLGSVFSVVYAIGRMLNGIISDRVAPRYMIASGLLLGGVANVLFSFFPPFPGLCLLWSLNAYSQSMLWSSILRLVSAMYDEQKAKKKVSYMVSSVAVGNIAGILLNTAIIGAWGIPFAFLLPGALLLFFALLCFGFCQMPQSDALPAKPRSFLLCLNSPMCGACSCLPLATA